MPRRSQAPRDEAADIERSGGRWRLRNWRLRTRLLVALLVPVVAMLVFAGLRVEGNLSSASQYAQATERVRVDDTVAALVHELQRERDLTVRYVAGGRQGPGDDVAQQRQVVDDARGEFDKAFTAARPELPDEAVGTFRQWENRLEGLTDARYAGQHSGQPSGQVLTTYNDLVAGLLDIADQAAIDTADRQLARTYLAAGSVARVKDALSIRRALVGEALAAGGPDERRGRALAGAEVRVDDARRDYAKFATEAQRRLLDDTLAPRVEPTNATADAVLGGDLSADPEVWDRQATAAVDGAKEVEDSLRSDVRQRSDALASSTRSHALIDGAVILGVLILAGLLAVAIARSLVRPLRTLRSSALDVAHYRLPEAVKGILTDPDPRPEDTHRRSVEPVPVYSREELGQVARAFDAVHGQAVRLAGEQAMLRENVNSMFVNLSRRSQDLMERQLTVLDRMEEHEQDPDVLGGLFELDHLATRMRRNSENLLVLAGQDVGRPLPGAVAAEEIVGAALSEVEHYQRINVAATPPIGVRGDVVGDLVHVISELFENATDYSPADTPVSVVSAVTQDGEWRIDITDRGAGMPETEIRRANVRLSEVPDVDVEVSRRMGLYVVARLARQHEIRVWLSAAELVGLTATVVVPAALISRAGLSSDSPVALEDTALEGAAPEGTALEGADDSAGGVQAQSVVFGPADVRPSRTALPAEPEPSEPLAPADEPESRPDLVPPVLPPPDMVPSAEPAEVRSDAVSPEKPQPGAAPEVGTASEVGAVPEVEETPMETSERQRVPDVALPRRRTGSADVSEAARAVPDPRERDTEEIHLPVRPPRLRSPAPPPDDEPRTEELPRIIGTHRELPPEPPAPVGSESPAAPAPASAPAPAEPGPPMDVPGRGAPGQAVPELPASGTAQAEAERAGAAGAEPVSAEPVNAEPVSAKPVNAEPVNAEPVNAEPEPVGSAARVLGRGRPVREPEPEPAEQTDVSGWGPGPTWPMRDDDERAAAKPAPQPQPVQEPAPREPIAQEPIAQEQSASDAGRDQIDGPTDRIEAYQRLVTRWFDPDTEVQDWLSEVAAATPNVNTAPRGADTAARNADTAPRGADTGANGEEASIDRSPDAIRRRMASLQQGTAEGRHARSR